MFMVRFVCQSENACLRILKTKHQLTLENQTFLITYIQHSYYLCLSAAVCLSFCLFDCLKKSYGSLDEKYCI